MGYAFGQDITLGFYPLVDNEPAVIPSAMQSQTPTIHVYRDMPTKAAAASGTGSPLQTITAWTWDAGKNGWTFTIPAVDDPDPSGTGPVNPYWVAINFRLASGEQTQLVLRSLDMERVSGHTRTLEVTDADLKGLFSKVTSYTTDDERLTFIDEAKKQIKAKLKAKDFAWAMLHRPDELKRVVTYKTLALICLDQVQSGNDKFVLKFTEFKEAYENEIGGLPIPVDTDGDGKPDAQVPSSGMIMFGR